MPRANYVIDDNWHTVGLRGTGSNDIVVEGAFVPEHRTHRIIDGFKQASPGHAINTAPLYKLPFGQIFVRSVSTSAIGMIKGALDAFTEVASKKIAASDGTKVSVDPWVQEICSRAAATYDEIRLVLHRNFEEMMTACRAGEKIPVERRVQFRYESSMATHKAMDAIDLLFSNSGGRAIFSDSKILRYFLDVHSARAHYANNPAKPARNYGGTQLGQQNTDFFI